MFSYKQYKQARLAVAICATCIPPRYIYILFWYTNKYNNKQTKQIYIAQEMLMLKEITPYFFCGFPVNFLNLQNFGQPGKGSGGSDCTSKDVFMR